MSEVPKKGDTAPDVHDPHVQTDKTKVDFAPTSATPAEFKFYPDNPESTLNKYRFSAKDASRFFDPCQESANMSTRCLETNDYDRDKCREYFDAYRECKKQWLRARRQNRGQWESN
ncbi:LAMI_0B02014g1_1 [Lachancea mirantina]|uniref:Cytochrome c oxidase-assembly factor COX23, mitochondrial n=1 Tax=Lachancea mirantina TaxID=1230905 RepID=A0A1G4ITX4_9SACH|nr:LAMI_0B02014g1_1 [Lachancea mirantina]